MLGALVKLQAGSSGATDGVLGKHALDGKLHRELGALVHQRAVLDILQVANPAGVMIVVLFVELSAGENRLVDVDNDDEIAAVDVRGEVNLVLAAQKLGSGDSRAAQGLAGCVENVPFSLDGLLLSHSGHVCFIHWKADAFYDKNF